jgi:hypothetical protein
MWNAVLIHKHHVVSKVPKTIRRLWTNVLTVGPLWKNWTEQVTETEQHPQKLVKWDCDWAVTPPSFRRNIPPPSLGSNYGEDAVRLYRKAASPLAPQCIWVTTLLAHCLTWSHSQHTQVDTEGGGSMSLRNIYTYLQECTVSQPERPQSEHS